MEDEAIIKGYDPVIMRRLMGYLRPYISIVLLAVIGLFMSTGAELLTPVIMQQAIDEHIVVRNYRLDPESLRIPELAELGLRGKATRIEDAIFVPSADFVVSRTIRNELREKNLLDENNWYVFPYRDEGKEIAEKYPDLFIDNGGYGAISMENLAKLPDGDAGLLRSRDVRGVLAKVVQYAGLLIVSLLFSFAQVYLMARTGQSVMKDMRLQLLDHTVHQSLSFLDSKPLGSLVSRATNDVETVNELFTNVATSFLKDISLMIGVIVTLFFLNSRLALITVCTLPPILVMTMIFRIRAREAYRRLRMWISRMNAFLSEHISGMEVVQMFGREKVSTEKFRDNNDNLLKANLAEMYVFATFRPLVDFFTAVSIGVIIYFGAGMLLRDYVSLGVLIAFINLIGKFYQPVMDLSEKFTILQSAMAGGERVFNLLDSETRIPDKGRHEMPQRIEGALEFDKVEFAYVPGESVLKKLSFKVEPGETVAIVGYTGAGKTTIANLLARLWDIQSGSIRIDGIDIRDLKLGDIRRTIQPVQQDVFIFADTIAENIRLGTNIPLEKIKQAARIVRADTFIEKMPDGYDTVLNERGKNLSMGQRQLLSFARVIAHDPRVIILDEATGSIDTETERLIQEAMDRLLEHRTSLVIAHRLSTIQNADRILVLSYGQLIEEGNHESLIAKEGVYYSLYKLQYEAGVGR